MTASSMRKFTKTSAAGKAHRLLTWRDSFPAKPRILDKPIFSPDPDSEPVISRTGLSTLIPRKARGSKKPGQVDNSSVSRKQAQIGFRQEAVLEKIDPLCDFSSRRESGFSGKAS